MPRIVILGTGTGVGKTYFTEALALALARRTPKPAVMAVKPIETGLRPNAKGSDAKRLERASTARPIPPHPLYGFRDPISPHLASRRAGRAISIPAIEKWLTTSTCYTALRDTTIHWTLIETAGGALSPLSRKTTNLDLAGSLEPAIWILVAPDSLGVLHDVSATLHAFRARSRAPDFLVLSAARHADASTGSNAAELAALGIAKPIVTLGRRKGAAALRRLVTAIHMHPLTSR